MDIKESMIGSIVVYKLILLNRLLKMKYLTKESQVPYYLEPFLVVQIIGRL